MKPKPHIIEVPLKDIPRCLNCNTPLLDMDCKNCGGIYGIRRVVSLADLKKKYKETPNAD